jgi:anti-sigma B factor antagonist
MHWTEIHERAAGDVVVLDVKGYMTLSDEQASLYSYVTRLADENRLKVLLNLRHVSYIDSIGIGEIVRVYMLLTQKGGMLRLCRVGPRIREVLVATHLHTVIGMFESEETALKEGYTEG